MKNCFQFKTYLDNRSELMALAIIGVLVTHLNVYFEPTTPIFSIAKKSTYFLFQSVYVEGFIFLSGMGVYYSLRKNKIWTYYMNRIKRVLIPFLLIGAPFFLFFCKGDCLKFFSMLTTAEFWLHGNYYGMWYIAILLLCYLIAPMIYSFVFVKSPVGAKLVVVILSVWGIGLALRISPTPVNEWYDNIAVFLVKVPFFIIGMYYGYLSSSERKVNIYCYLVLLVVVFVSFFIIHRVNGSLVYGYHILTLRMIQITFICLIINYFKEKHFVNKTFAALSWISRYTLEIYLLHLLLYNSLATIWPSVSKLLFMILSVIASLVICKPINQLMTKVAH